MVADRWVLVGGSKIAAVNASRPAAERVLDRPGRFVLPGLLNLHNHSYSEAIARTHTEDGGGRGTTAASSTPCCCRCPAAASTC